MSRERRIDVQWNNDPSHTYPVSIKIRTDDRFGLLADIASVISKYKSNILNARSQTNDEGIGMFYFTLLVESSDQLRSIMADIKRVKKVIDVKRIVSTE